MNFRAAVMLFLGLVVQLAQVRPISGVSPTGPCAPAITATSCCDGPQSCPCIDRDDSSHKPAPVVPASGDLKFNFPVPSGTDLAEAPAPAPSHADGLPIRGAGTGAGFAGVPLSVAFCSFVI